MLGYYGVAMDTRGALDVPGQAMCQVTMEFLCKLKTIILYVLQSKIVTSQAKG